MRIRQAFASIALAAVAALSSAGALAAPVPVVVGTGATAAAGDTVQPTLSFEFPGLYELIALDLRFEYDGSQLSFDEAASKVTLDGVLRSLPDFLAFLNTQGSALKNYGTDGSGQQFGDYSFASVNGIQVTSALLFQPVFHLAPNVAAGTHLPVHFSGELADQSATTSGDAFELSIEITAVPEPEQWALLAGGLALTGLVARRRRA